MPNESLLSHNGSLLTYNNHGLYFRDPNPLKLGPWTMRFQFDNESYDPRTDKKQPSDSGPRWKTGYTWTQVSASPNIWDYTRVPNIHGTPPDQTTWTREFKGCFNTLSKTGKVHVLGANLAEADTLKELFNVSRCIEDVAYFETINVTDMSYMFRACGIASVPRYHTNNVTNMSNMFYDCNSLVDVPSFDTSKVTDMSLMFAECDLLENIPFLDTSSVTNMNGMFWQSHAIKTVPLFNTSNVTTMDDMFSGCHSLNEVPLLNTSNVTTMSYMFNWCYNLSEVPLFNTSKVTNMECMFDGCTVLTTVPLFDTRNVSNMSFMFRQCTSLQTVPLFNTPQVTNMRYMFYGCSALTEVPLFDTTSMNDMRCSFYNTVMVEHGSYNLYMQASNQARPPSIHEACFYNCGVNTPTGLAEWNAIDNTWKSDMT